MPPSQSKSGKALVAYSSPLHIPLFVLGELVTAMTAFSRSRPEKKVELTIKGSEPVLPLPTHDGSAIELVALLVSSTDDATIQEIIGETFKPIWRHSNMGLEPTLDDILSRGYRYWHPSQQAVLTPRQPLKRLYNFRSLVAGLMVTHEAAPFFFPIERLFRLCNLELSAPSHRPAVPLDSALVDSAVSALRSQNADDFSMDVDVDFLFENRPAPILSSSDFSMDVDASSHLRLTLVVDTNAFIRQPRLVDSIRQLLPAQAFHALNVDLSTIVAVSHQVLRELDGLKQGRGKLQGDHRLPLQAREAIAVIRSSLDDQFVIGESHSEFNASGMHKLPPDMRILSYTKRIMAGQPSELEGQAAVVIVTEDAGLCVAARSDGVRTLTLAELELLYDSNNKSAPEQIRKLFEPLPRSSTGAPRATAGTVPPPPPPPPSTSRTVASNGARSSVPLPPLNPPPPPPSETSYTKEDVTQFYHEAWRIFGRYGLTTVEFFLQGAVLATWEADTADSSLPRPWTGHSLGQILRKKSSLFREFLKDFSDRDVQPLLDLDASVRVREKSGSVSLCDVVESLDLLVALCQRLNASGGLDACEKKVRAEWADSIRCARVLNPEAHIGERPHTKSACSNDLQRGIQELTALRKKLTT